MQQSSFEEFEKRMTKKMSADGRSFDPASIIAMIAAIIPMITGCFGSNPSAMRRRFGNRARIASSLRQQSSMSWSESFKAADMVLDLAQEATDEELINFSSQCCGGDQWPQG